MTNLTQLSKPTPGLLTSLMVIVLFMLFSLNANAQNKIKLFAGPSFQTELRNANRIQSIGMELGMQHQSGLIVGLFANRGLLHTEQQALEIIPLVEPDIISSSNKGIILGYRPMRTQLLQFGFSAKFGSAELEQKELTTPKFTKSTVKEKLFVVAPQAELIIQPIDWLQLNFGLGYQVNTGGTEFANKTNAPIINCSLHLNIF